MWKSKHDMGSEKRDDIMEKAKQNIFKNNVTNHYNVTPFASPSIPSI